MPNYEQGSPGAKIRDWLFKAESTAKPKSIRGQAKKSKRGHTVPLETKSPNRSLDASHLVRIQRNKKSAIHGERGTRQESPYHRTIHERRHPPADEHGPKLKHHRHRVAHCRRLQRPPQRFENDARSTSETSRSRKRRRTSLSASPDRQSACIADLDCTTYDGKHMHYGYGAKDTRHTNRTTRGVTVSTVSNHSPLLLSSPKQPAETFERRKRRKTHEDRYEVSYSKKEHEKLEVQSKRVQKPVKARKHKEKSGEALMQDFTASNVITDRLTLKPGKTAGLFGRGKASSPVKRRGLPDLAFSEWAFLNTTRCKVTEGAGSASKEETRKAMKVKKAADTEAAISHYFIAGKSKIAGNVEATDDLGHPREQQHGKLHDSVWPAIDQPEKPFLGFGIKGNTPVSPAVTIKDLNANYVNSMSQQGTRSPNSSTSYLTWSRSGTPLSVSEHRPRAPRSRPLEIANGHRPSHSESQSFRSGGPMPSRNDRSMATPPEQAMRATAGRTLSGAVTNDAEVGRVHKPRVHHSTDIDHLPFSRPFRSRSPIMPTAKTSGRIASDSNVGFGAKNLAAAVLSQHEAHKGTLSTTQSASGALLPACKPKLRDSSTRKPDFDAEANTEELSTTAPYQRDQITRVLDQKSPERLTSLRSEPKAGFQPVAQIHDASRPNTLDRAGYCHGHGQRIMTMKSEPTHDLYLRSRAMEIEDLQNPAAQNPWMSPVNAPKAYNSSCLYTRTHSVNNPESYAFDIEDGIYGQLQNVEGHDFSHAYTSPEEIIPAYDFRQDHLDEVAQDHLADKIQTYPETMDFNYQRAHPRPNMAAAEWATEDYLPMLGAPSYYSGTREPCHSRPYEVPQQLEFNVNNRPQTSISHASLTDGFCVTPLARARERNTLQARSVLWTRDGSEVEPVGFWKPNRLY